MWVDAEMKEARLLDGQQQAAGAHWRKLATMPCTTSHIMGVGSRALLRGGNNIRRRACRVDSSRPPASTGTSLPTRSLASAGVATMAVRVDTEVIATESGTSARARNVTTLEATPPGHDATRQILQGRESL